MQKKRPKHLDLGKISLPIMAKVSILHRISGVALFLALPLLIYLLQGSLSSEADFEAYRAVVAFPLMKLILLGLLWAFLHTSVQASASSCLICTRASRSKPPVLRPRPCSWSASP